MAYYDMGILRHNKLFNFVVGNRGAGKTYGCKKWCINDFLKNGNQFVWVRRYKSELKKISMFFADIHHEFPKNNLHVKGNVAYCDKKIMGYFIPLSTALTEKSNSYPDVNKIIFDEFVIDKGAIRYLPNEAECFLELYETVARLRDVRAVFLSNAITVINPYFMYFDVFPTEKERFTIFDDIIIDNFKDEDFTANKHLTRFGKIVSGTNFSRYAIDNEFLRDNEDFILDKLPTPNRHEGTLKYMNNYYNIYWCYNENVIYVKKVKNANSNKVYAITINDHTENTMLLKSQNISPLFNRLKMGFKIGVVWYDDIKTKNQFYEIVKLLSMY